MEFSSEAITEACIKIAVHRKIGKLWRNRFPTQQAAAESWLDYQSRYPHATLEQWFGQFDNSVLPPQRDRPRIL